MAEFMGATTTWYNAPDLHEICKCDDCHDEGCHENRAKHWAKKGCNGCFETMIEKEIIH